MGFFDKARGKLAVRTNEGASPKMQSLWRSMPAGQKNQLRRTLPDSDRDGVPDKFDCQPFNPRKQDYDPDAEADLQARIKMPRKQDSEIGGGACPSCGADLRQWGRARGVKTCPYCQALIQYSMDEYRWIPKPTEE